TSDHQLHSARHLYLGQKQSTFPGRPIYSIFPWNGPRRQRSRQRTRLRAVCLIPLRFRATKRAYDIPLPPSLWFPITSSAKSAKLLAASSMACSYLSLSHISTIFIAEEMTNSLSIPANDNKSLGISSRPAESSSTVFTPAVH